MAEHTDGLYTVGCGVKPSRVDHRAADILYEKAVSSGYSHRNEPLFCLAIERFLCDDRVWSSGHLPYFTNPQLIAPINLIKWKD